MIEFLIGVYLVMFVISLFTFSEVSLKPYYIGRMMRITDMLKVLVFSLLWFIFIPILVFGLGRLEKIMGDIPAGYVILEHGQPMKADDLIWRWDEAMTREAWRLFGDCADVGYPYNESYRPVVRKTL